MSPEANNGKDDNGREDGSNGIGDTDSKRVLEGVVLPLAVAGEGNEGPCGHAQREEDLGGCLQPHLRGHYFFTLEGGQRERERERDERENEGGQEQDDSVCA